jgi:hypothetical protein
MESVSIAKYRLGKITSKYLILDVIFCVFYRSKGFTFLHQASRSLRKLLKENYQAGKYMSIDAFSRIENPVYHRFT